MSVAVSYQMTDCVSAPHNEKLSSWNIYNPHHSEWSDVKLWYNDEKVGTLNMDVIQNMEERLKARLWGTRQLPGFWWHDDHILLWSEHWLSILLCRIGTRDCDRLHPKHSPVRSPPPPRLPRRPRPRCRECRKTGEPSWMIWLWMPKIIGIVMSALYSEDTKRQP